MKQRFTMVFETDADPLDERDDYQRLKLLLKRIWRDYGFKCLSVEKVTDEQEDRSAGAVVRSESHER